MISRIEILINQNQIHQLTQAAIAINKENKSDTFKGCVIMMSDHIAEYPDKEYMIIQYPDNQTLFDLAKTFGIILEKVSPQSL